MQGKTTFQQELGETGQKYKQVQNRLGRKRTGPPLTIKHQDRHSPELQEIGLPEAGRKR